MHARRHCAAQGLASCLALLALCSTAQPGTASQAALATLTISAPIPQNLRFCLGEQTCEVGDVNGDSKADLIVFVRNTLGRARAGEVWAALASESGFEKPTRWLKQFCVGNEECTIGDVDGNGAVDLVAFIKDTRGADQLGQVLIALSNGSSFEQPISAVVYKDSTKSQLLRFCVGNEICRVADLDQDKKADFVGFTRNPGPERTGYVWLTTHTSLASDNASVFTIPVVLATNFCLGEAECMLGDVNGDSHAEPISFIRESKPGDTSNHVEVYFPTDLTKTDVGRRETWHEAFCLLNERCMLGNMDGPIDEKETKYVDLIAFSSQQQDDGTVSYSVKIALSMNGYFSNPPLEFQGDYCPGNDICRIADIDHNGQDDIIAFDRSVSSHECVGNVQISFAWNQRAIPPKNPTPSRPTPTQALQRPAIEASIKTFFPLLSAYSVQPVYCIS